MSTYIEACRQQGWNPQIIVSPEGLHEDIAYYFEISLLSGIKWGEVFKSRLSQGNFKGPMLLMRTDTRHNHSNTLAVPPITIGAAAVDLYNTLSICPEDLSDIPLLDDSTTSIAQSPKFPSVEQFRAWENRELELDPDGYTHTTVFEIQQEDVQERVIVGYVPNDGTDTLYLSNIG